MKKNVIVKKVYILFLNLSSPCGYPCNSSRPKAKFKVVLCETLSSTPCNVIAMSWFAKLDRFHAKYINMVCIY